MKNSSKKDTDSKYGKITEYKDIKFRSKFEATFARYLDELGLRWEYESVVLPYVPRIVNYVPDFKVWRPSGREDDWFLVELKGWFDTAARVKMMQIKQQYPHYDIKMMFQNPDLKVGATKTLTYKAWGKKHNYDLLTKDYLRNLVGKNDDDTKQTDVQNKKASVRKNTTGDVHIRRTRSKTKRSDDGV